MREPDFWWRDASLASGLLAPLGAVYGGIAAWRMARKGARADVPVICVGNFTLGGAGKTPTVMKLVSMLRAAGETPYCLSRGYGGCNPGPKQVDSQTDSAAEVGDEALLLARVAPTIVSRDRAAGAQVVTAAGASVIVMDDGLQNASLAKDFTLAVVDGRRGFGNGCVFPAGPLRAPLAAQIAHSDAALVMGEVESTSMLNAIGQLPTFYGKLVSDRAAVAALKGRNVLAFAGIGDPEKFFDTLVQAGIGVPQCRAFDDHHRFTAAEAASLLGQAERENLTLVTTEKDRARMTGDSALAMLAAKAQVLPVTLVVDKEAELQTLMMAAVRRRRSA
jgi:tetraacyldisaccharide 4'-kinase